MDCDFQDNISDLADNDDDSFGWEDYSQEEWDKELETLTSDNISKLRVAIFESEKAQDGKVPLQCKGLSEPPKPKDILD